MEIKKDLTIHLPEEKKKVFDDKRGNIITLIFLSFFCHNSVAGAPLDKESIGGTRKWVGLKGVFGWMS